MVAMANQYFQMKQFTVWQDQCAMKVTTDACLFGAWAAAKIVDSGQMTDDSKKPPFVTTINNVTHAQALAIESQSTPNDQRSTSNGQRPATTRQLSSILDIGTGTGLLSLMLAQKTTASIDAVEIDPLAAEQATQNIQTSPWGNRVQVITDDIAKVDLGHPYHTIISNPPFFENQLASPDAGRQKALHASELSLSALFTAMARWLHPQGTLYLLLPAYRMTELEKLAAQNKLHLQTLTWVKQTPRHEPFRMLVQLGFALSGLQQNTITIREADQRYSEVFTALLKDYYLHL